MAEHILYLSYDGMTDQLGQSQVLPYLMGLTEQGYVFHLVSFEKPDLFKQRASQIKDLIKGRPIHWYPQSYTKTPPVISTLCDIIKMSKVAKRIIKSKNPKIIHARSYISGIVAQKLSHDFQIPFLFDMRGFWADERVDGNIWSLRNPVYNFIYRYFKKKEKLLLNSADAIVSLTENAKNEMNRWGIDQVTRKTTVIPCCCDTNLFDPENLETDREYDKIKGLLQSSDGPVFVYLGAIGTWYLLNEMLDFFQVVLKDFPRATFLFITREPQKQILLSAKTYGIPEGRIIITGSDRKFVPALLSLADYGIFFIKPSFSKKASSPTKQGELMAMGIPVFCNSGVGDTDFIIQKYHSGIIVDPLNKSGYTQAIGMINELEKLDKHAIRKGAVAYFSLENGVKLYSGIYKQLSGQ